MKIITQKPILVLTAEEKATLEKAKKILDEITNEDAEVVEEILYDCGYCFDNVVDAYSVVDALIDNATTANSEDAKHLVVQYTAQLVVG